MGRKAGIMRVNPNFFGKRTRPCISEMLTFLACLKKSNFNEDGCMLEKKSLKSCMELQKQAKSGLPSQGSWRSKLFPIFQCFPSETAKPPRTVNLEFVISTNLSVRLNRRSESVRSSSRLAMVYPQTVSSGPTRSSSAAHRQPVVDLLHCRGVKPRTEWLLSCLNQLAASDPGFVHMPAARKAELCFEQFLMADFNVAGAASLPPLMHTLHATELSGPFVLQVDEIIDISNSSRDRYQEKAAGPGRVLKLSMTDGVQRVFGMEYKPIRGLQVLSPTGFKVSLRNVCIRRGLLILVPEVVEVLGGVVDHLEAARLRAVETINKPPRGRRVPRGVREPSLAERATRAAWPDESAGSHGSTGIATPGTTNLRQVTVPPREEQQFTTEDQVADLTRPSTQVTSAPRSAVIRAERSAPGHDSVQEIQRPTSREAFGVSVTYQSATGMDGVQQPHYPLQQDRNSLSSTRGSSTPRPARVEEVQDEQHHPSQEEHGGESSRQPAKVSFIQQSLRVETLQQAGGQQQKPSHVERETEPSRQSSKMKQSATHALEGSTTPLSSQSPGAPLLSPSFGKLSLRSRRSTPATAPQHINLQSSQPSEFSSGDEPARPVEIIDSQENEQGNVPFTYLATLEDIEKTNVGQSVKARGRVKCVIAGVGKFQYKGCDEFKLLLHIEDGTLITECSVKHQVVQDLIGHGPVEVSSKLGNPDTHQEMLEKMIRFQKFLERFEGYMDLEFRSSSLVPVVLNIVEGVETTDAKFLLKRLELSLAK